jgi:hypothetical protein
MSSGGMAAWGDGEAGGAFLAPSRSSPGSSAEDVCRRPPSSPTRPEQAGSRPGRSGTNPPGVTTSSRGKRIAPPSHRSQGGPVRRRLKAADRALGHLATQQGLIRGPHSFRRTQDKVAPADQFWQVQQISDEHAGYLVPCGFEVWKTDSSRFVSIRLIGNWGITVRFSGPLMTLPRPAAP